MKSDELQEKIEATREELESLKQQFELAVAEENGLKLGETLVKGRDGAIYLVTQAKKMSEFVNITGLKKLKNGAFSDHETYIGILGHNGCEIAASQEKG